METINRTITISNDTLINLKKDKLKVSFESNKILTWNEYFDEVLNKSKKSINTE